MNDNRVTVGNDNNNTDTFLVETLTDAGLTEAAAVKAIATLKDEGFIDYAVANEQAVA